MKTAKIKETVKLLGTSLVLNKGETVMVWPASNLPGGGWFASPISNSWGDDAILLSGDDLVFLSNSPHGMDSEEIAKMLNSKP